MGVLSRIRSFFTVAPEREESPAAVAEHQPQLAVQPPPAKPRPAPPALEGWGHFGAVGESQYQDVLFRISRSGQRQWATLVPEPDNPFDRSAVAVQIEDMTVGYLRRGDARRYQKRLLQLPTPLEVPAKLIGGTPDKPNFGVLLDCRQAEALPKPTLVRRKKVTVDSSDQPF